MFPSTSTKFNWKELYFPRSQGNCKMGETVKRVGFFFAFAFSVASFYTLVDYVVLSKKQSRNKSAKKPIEPEKPKPITIRKSMDPEGDEEKGLPRIMDSNEEEVCSPIRFSNCKTFVVHASSFIKNFFYQDESGSKNEGL